MVPIPSLLVPALLAAGLVFVASFVMHMVLPHHRSDFAAVPDEDALMAALRPLNLPPGEYMLPRPATPGAMKDPAFLEKMSRGPKAFFTVMPPGPPTMGKQLALWFAFCVFVGILAAYVAGRALPPGGDRMNVFRFAGTVAFIAYTVADWSNSIWYQRKWSTTLKNTFDGLVYGVLTGLAFAWLWPA
jgi:hypothetical protein